MQLSLLRNKNILLRILSILMALLILIMPIFVPMAEAVVLEATAASSGAIYVVGCMLIAGGFAIARGDLNDVAASMYRAGSTGFRNLVDTTAAVWDKGGKFAVKVSAELKDAFNSLVDSLYAVDSGYLTNPVSTAWQDCMVQGWWTSAEYANATLLPAFGVSDGGTFKIADVGTGAYVGFRKVLDGAETFAGNSFVMWSDASDVTFCGYGVQRVDATTIYIRGVFSYVDSNGKTVYGSCALADVSNSYLRFTDAYIATHDYMGSATTAGWYVGKVTDTPTWYDIPTDAIIKSPDGITKSEDLVDAAPADILQPNYDLTQDQFKTFPIGVPYPDVQTGIDAGVGEGEGEGAGEGTGEGSINLPAIPSLTMPSGITDKFPFCLPFDVYRIFKALVVEPVRPVISFPIKIGNYVDASIDVDLAPYDTLFELAKWGEYVIFLVGLAFVTSKVIKW